MKYILILLFVSSNAMAQKDTLINLPVQDGKVFYEHIYQDRGMMKNDLFIKAKDAFLRLFPDTKDVIQEQDKEAGIISGKGYFSFNTRMGPFHILNTQRFRNTIRIIVKDDKYKIEIFDFYLIPLFENMQEKPIEEMYNVTKAKSLKKSYDYYINFNDRVLQLSGQIESEMNKKLSTDF